MTVSEHIWSYLADRGVSHVFYLPGGGSMHLNDALVRNERIKPICMLHEQSCAISAASYAMYKNDLGVCCVTSGPGGTNALTGVAAAWTDYIPLMVISGQVPTKMRMRRGERQYGPQEVEVTDMASPVTKWASVSGHAWVDTLVRDALSHPRGPVWLDVPLDVQGAEI